MVATILLMISAPQVRVSTSAELQRALQNARPGTEIIIAQGVYSGGVFASGIHGTAAAPIVIRGAEPKAPPVFRGGNSGIQLSNVSHIKLTDISIQGVSANGLNIDDGGTITKPSHHVHLERIRVSDLPKGNHDAIKLSGIDSFRIKDCEIARWGGSGIDMVGCHKGEIIGCRFENGGDTGIQAKGGCSDIAIQKCKFSDAGQRAVNLGGSTGLQFFRPPVAAMGNQKYEARNLTVEGCEFTGSTAAIAFVGSIGVIVRQNTILNPERWAVRILQETRDNGFVACQGGTFDRNLVAFHTSRWASGGFNIGSGTRPETFKFTNNWWYCLDNPQRSKPDLPVPESGGTYGIKPDLQITHLNEWVITPDEATKNVGAHSWRSSD